jgi:DNA-binding NarL/FixJ family response regulator
VLAALRSGASAFVLKEAPPEDILGAIHSVASGKAVIDPAVVQAVIDELARRPPRAELAASIAELTPREREVLSLLARGLSNAEIAAELVVGEGTVKTHVARVLAKLDVRDRVQAVVFAYEAGIV